jgi:hypothetical protein
MQMFADLGVSTTTPPRQLLLDQPLPPAVELAGQDLRPGAGLRTLNRGA